MKQTRIVMGMPITVELVADDQATIDVVFDHFIAVDQRYSTYKPDSEISRINRGLPKAEWSSEMRRVLELCEETKQLTNGYFDIRRSGKLDPSGLVKGWAIHNAALLLVKRGAKNFYIEAGGDIQTHGKNSAGSSWQTGIRNPFKLEEIVKVVRLSGDAIATSGTYVRGTHIYNPRDDFKPAMAISSLSVIGPNIYEADRFATAAFAMGADGISFIESRPGLEGYMIDNDGMATMTSNFERYAV